jgi:hypothetical protein
MKSEPAAGIGAFISAVLLMTWTILDSQGVALTDDLKNSVEAVIYALIAMPAVAGFLIRAFVTPTARAEEQMARLQTTAQAAVDTAYLATPGTDPKPVILPTHHAV